MSENKELSRLIILGAGASVECGVYPTGVQLIEFSKKIIEWFGTGTIDKTDVVNRTKPYLLNLISSGHLSIDSHISLIDDKDEREFIKSYYLFIFLFCTACSEISQDFENSWYTEFSKLILTPLSVDKSNKERLEVIEKNLEKLQIITFNYDVSLEISLRKSLKRYFNKKGDDYGSMVSEALKAVSKKIYHPYGSIATIDEILEINFEKLTADQVGRNITKSFEDEIAKKQKNFVEILEETKSRFFSAVAFGKSVKIYKQFKDVIELDSSDDGSFCYSQAVFQTVVDVADKIKDIDDLNFFSSARIKVISKERENLERENLKKEILSKVFDQKPDLLYILGYGFDETNNEILGLKNIKYQKGCFVTNYASDESEINQRLERLILEELLSRYQDCWVNRNGPKKYFVPLISHKSVSQALKEDFSLFENPASPFEIQTTLTPYLEMKK